MDAQDSRGVVFPADEAGRRSTTALGRAVVADALRAVSPEAARRADQQGTWREGYLAHFRALVEVGLARRADALSVASAGLGSLHARMRAVQAGGTEAGLDRLFEGPPGETLVTTTVKGKGAAVRELDLPYRGARLRGVELQRQLDAWVAAGVIEPSCAAAVREVADNPDWLDLSGHTVVALGAGSEMGPLRALLRWGGTVAAVDLPRPAIWTSLIDAAERSGGTLLVPVPSGGGGSGGYPAAVVPDVAGADLLQRLPAVAGWLSGLDRALVLGNYVYADGANNVRLSVAVDALTVALQRQRPDAALAFLATPTDVFAVPPEAVEQASRGYAGARAPARLGRRLLRAASGGKLLKPNYPDRAEVGICDALVPQQGPNYALAKRLQRWRAAVARDEGTRVSFKVAPPTRTKSVVKNKALAAAYAGAHRFGIEVFEPATSNTLMAALLVHDLRSAPAAADLPWQDEALGAAHGGLWRGPYEPRSALGLAALLGIGVARP